MAHLHPLLILDDHHQTIRACRKALCDGGFDVMHAVNIEDALDIVIQRSPRTLLADAAILWKCEYSAFFRQLHKLVGSEKCFVVLVVPPRFSQHKLDVLRQFVDHSIFKPFSVEDLLDVITKHAGVTVAYGLEGTSHACRKVAESIESWEIRVGDSIAGCHIEGLLG